MKIKENNIIHYFIFKERQMRYLCNQACSISIDKITNDFHRITCKNCKRLIIKHDLLKIPVEKRTEAMHHILIKHFGGVRNYLLSMGKFKEDEEDSWTDESIEHRIIEKEGGFPHCSICGKLKWFWQKLCFDEKEHGTCHLKCFKKLKGFKINEKKKT